MTPLELKNSILQLAIQGKLVEQREEEGTAEELYKEIQEEKARLVKEGKIKKEKPLLEIAEDEKPFEIPQSWMWVCWGEIINIVSARRVHQSDWKNEGIPFYRAREIAKLAENGYVDNDLFISQELFDEFSKSGVPQPGDLMVTAVGTLGKTYIVQPDDHFYYKDASVICLENYAHIYPEFLKYLMNSEMMMNQIRSNSDGTTVATLTMVRMVEYIIPLPPLEEQKRIVAKIEELLPLVDRYEAAYKRLEAFDKRFPDDMQKSILQMAIQGKLVEQRAEKGTGEELYQQIQAEKQKLIQSGKIKKDKPLPDITDDEKPFDIPESWMWVRFSELASFLNGDRGKNYPNREEYVNKGIAWINTGHITPSGYLDIDTMNYIIEEKYNSLRNGKIEEGDLVYCLRGATFGKVARVEPFSTGAVASSLMIIRLFNIDLREYILTYLRSSLSYQQLRLYDNGSAQPNLAAKDVAKYLIPLPPLEEQKRIVAKLEELLPLCQKLQALSKG